MEITFSELIEHLESFPVTNNFQFIHFQWMKKLLSSEWHRSFSSTIITSVAEREIYFILFCFDNFLDLRDIPKTIQSKVSFHSYISIVMLELALSQSISLQVCHSLQVIVWQILYHYDLQAIKKLKKLQFSQKIKFKFFHSWNKPTVSNGLHFPWWWDLWIHLQNMDHTRNRALCDIP